MNNMVTYTATSITKKAFYLFCMEVDHEIPEGFFFTTKVTGNVCVMTATYPKKHNFSKVEAIKRFKQAGLELNRDYHLTVDYEV